MYFLLRHMYNFWDSANNVQIEDKILGIYSTNELAKQAIERYHKLPGFCDYPKSCFIIEKRKINEDTAWREGFSGSGINGLSISSWVNEENIPCEESAKEYAKRLIKLKNLPKEYDLCEGLIEEYMNLIIYGELYYGLKYLEGETLI